MGRRAAHGASIVAALWALAGAGCRSTAVGAREGRHPVAAAHLFVRRPFRAVPEPDPFIQGAMIALSEEVVRSGYDYMGTSIDPDGEDAVLDELQRANELRPGTAGVHLVFIEAPSLVGFGLGYTSIECTVYGPQGEVLLRELLESPPRRQLVQAVLPSGQPDVDGRYWASRVWTKQIAAVFPLRS